VRTTGLTKRFRTGQVAVDDLELLVPRGSVMGFLGPNGSGKTTTIRMLLGLVAPTSGQVELLGEQIPQASARVLPRVGALVEGPAFHPYLSGRANLVRLDAADLTVDRRTSTARIDAALERVGLGAAAGKRFRTYSLGPTAWTRRAPARSAPWSASWPPRAAPSSCPPTCSPRSSRCATG
jgi:ABC-2 type transport system ATP-binding protein